ncbi:NAC domain-containing protein 14 isoform X4 [Zea mays]|nr:uncharacterized protein LOC100383037 isoform X4 [Zea mays]
MHEYRTTEPQFESGKQGGYVLYRLFWKPEEKTERSSPKEMDRSGNSPTTIRSSRDNQEANEEANTPLNKKSLESALHDPIELPNSAETPAGPRKMCLADRNDNLVATAPVVSHIPFQGHAAGVAKQVDPSAAASAHFVNPQNGNDDCNNFMSDFTPILPHENAFFTGTQQGAFGFDGNGIMNHPDALDAFLNQTLVDTDEHSSTTSKVQYDSDIPTEFANHWNMQDEHQDWWEKLDFEPYEPTLLPYDTTDLDVLSVDSGADSFNDLFNVTGITLRPQQLDSTVQPDCVFPDQGTALRRLKLQVVECGESITKDESEDEVSCVESPNYFDESVEFAAEKGVASYGDGADSTGIVIRSRYPAPSSSSESSFTQQGTAMRRLRLQLGLNEGTCPSSGDSSSCIVDESESQQKAEIEEDASTNLAGSVDNLPGNSHDDEQKDIPEHDAEMSVSGVKSVLRLRKTSAESLKDVKQEDCLEPDGRAPMQRVGFQSSIIWLVLSVAVLLLLYCGVWMSMICILVRCFAHMGSWHQPDV